MPFGYLKRMFFKTRPKKALLTRTSTLPEINLASPIYIVIENAEDDPIQNTIDESNDDLIIPGINRQGGRDSMTINADVSPLVTPPPPIVIDDDDVEEPSGTPVEDNDFPRGEDVNSTHRGAGSPPTPNSPSSPSNCAAAELTTGRNSPRLFQVVEYLEMKNSKSGSKTSGSSKGSGMDSEATSTTSSKTSKGSSIKNKLSSAASSLSKKLSSKKSSNI
ncbi:uncharacterized protein LOC134846725 [Symsagittifera roscoffensis]|uniref:uncharacterized protein LOC134846725 n=1 Tax=Symsagittifera roscoffensis TaxID=84072 RepID=UPI00307C0F6B